MYEDRSPSGAAFAGAGGATGAGVCLGESGDGFFVAINGGASCGRGAALGCSAGADCLGDGSVGAVGGTIGPGGFNRKVSWMRLLGSSPSSEGDVNFGGAVHNAAIWMQIDNATVTQILGITTPSCLPRNTSVRSLIYPLLPRYDGGIRTTG